MAAALAEALQQLSCDAGGACSGSDYEDGGGAERLRGEAEAGCSAAPGGEGDMAASPVKQQGARGLGWSMG